MPPMRQKGVFYFVWVVWAVTTPGRVGLQRSGRRESVGWRSLSTQGGLAWTVLACAGSAHPQARAPRPDTARLTQLLKAPRLAQGTEVWVLGVGASMFAVMPAAGEQGSLKRKEIRR